MNTQLYLGKCNRNYIQINDGTVVVVAMTSCDKMNRMCFYLSLCLAIYIILEKVDLYILQAANFRWKKEITSGDFRRSPALTESPDHIEEKH